MRLSLNIVIIIITTKSPSPPPSSVSTHHHRHRHHHHHQLYYHIITSPTPLLPITRPPSPRRVPAYQPLPCANTPSCVARTTATARLPPTVRFRFFFVTLVSSLAAEHNRPTKTRTTQYQSWPQYKESSCWITHASSSGCGWLELAKVTQVQKRGGGGVGSSSKNYVRRKEKISHRASIPASNTDVS